MKAIRMSAKKVRHTRRCSLPSRKTRSLNIWKHFKRTDHRRINESFAEKETHSLDLHDCDRGPACARRFVYVDKILPRREGSLCERRGTFQIRFARRGGRSRRPLLSLDGFAARFSRPDAGARRLQIAWCCLGRGT